MESDDLMMEALDAGAEDFREEEDHYEVITSPDAFYDVEKALKDKGLTLAEAEVTQLPQTYVKLTNEKDINAVERILDLLDESDDVQNVYHNWDDEE